VLPLGKVGPIEMRQLARGYINERLLIAVSETRRIIEEYSGVFVLVATALILLLLLTLLTVLRDMI
jgi:hypothetical protein